jgi:Lrp/AsnC family leucine-responsive transcriptional regulator
VLALDSIDRRILELLTASSTLTNQQLADQLELSASQCSRRMTRLRDLGVIQREVAILSPEALGLDIKAYLMVTLSEAPGRAEAFQQLIRSSPEIVKCCAITGEIDFILKVYSPDMLSFQRLLARITDTELVLTIKTNIVIMDIKPPSPQLA